MVKRVSSGVDGLDNLIEGGFPQESIVLVSGSPGTGKTIMGLQFLYQGMQKKEKGLFVTLDERVNKLLSDAEKVGFDFHDGISRGFVEFKYLDPEQEEDVVEPIKEEVKKGSYDRLVVDSMTSLSQTPVILKEIENSPGIMEVLDSMIPVPLDSSLVTRMHANKIINEIRKLGCTTILTSELLEGSRGLSRDTITEFLVDGVLVLTLDETMDLRKLKVRKLRGVKHTLKPQTINITDEGIKLDG